MSFSLKFTTRPPLWVFPERSPGFGDVAQHRPYGAGAASFADGFFQALRSLPDQAGAPDLVVEIHETAVVEVARMRELAARLAGIGVSFAYDDWGAGQARINELADVPAQYVKFDMGLVREIHRASERKQKLVRDLVRMVLDVGSVPLAEGVEFEADADLCRDMGFSLLQGYHTGRPVPVESLS